MLTGFEEKLANLENWRNWRTWGSGGIGELGELGGNVGGNLVKRVLRKVGC